jgi:hypothetical protein
MSNRKFLAAALAVLALPLLASCVASPPPNVVYVRTAPPPIQSEVIGVAPGTGYVWIRGYHRWDANAYVWVPGRWEQPPHSHAKWVDGRWHHDSHGYYYTGGHWKS